MLNISRSVHETPRGQRRHLDPNMATFQDDYLNIWYMIVFFVLYLYYFFFKTSILSILFLCDKYLILNLKYWYTLQSKLVRFMRFDLLHGNSIKWGKSIRVESLILCRQFDNKIKMIKMKNTRLDFLVWWTWSDKIRS